MGLQYRERAKVRWGSFRGPWWSLHHNDISRLKGLLRTRLIGCRLSLSIVCRGCRSDGRRNHFTQPLGALLQLVVWVSGSGTLGHIIDGATGIIQISNHSPPIRQKKFKIQTSFRIRRKIIQNQTSVKISKLRQKIL